MQPSLFRWLAKVKRRLPRWAIALALLYFAPAREADDCAVGEVSFRPLARTAHAACLTLATASFAHERPFSRNTLRLIRADQEGALYAHRARTRVEL